jgi:hypothetical protein
MDERYIESTIPPEYRKMLFVGERNRAGNIIEFHRPLVFVKSPYSREEYKRKILSEHIDASKIPLIYQRTQPFIIIRPTSLEYTAEVKQRLGKLGLIITNEINIDNFIKLSDSLYELSDDMPFTLSWRIITRALHDSGLQNQNTAVVLMIGNKFNSSNDYQLQVLDNRQKIREDIGSIPYIVQYLGETIVAMDLHHLHAPDFDRLSIEYNALMHAVNKTSIFAE